jgi:hypothetical protein
VAGVGRRVGHGRVALPGARVVAALGHQGQEGIQTVRVEMGAAASTV